MEARMRKDLFLKDRYGDDYEREVVAWYVLNIPLIEAYHRLDNSPLRAVMKAVVDSFVADCNMYAVCVIDNHDEWKLLNKQAIENTRYRIQLLLEHEKNRQIAVSAPSTDPLAKRLY